jgi:hypothetical protein
VYLINCLSVCKTQEYHVFDCIGTLKENSLKTDLLVCVSVMPRVCKAVIKAKGDYFEMPPLGKAFKDMIRKHWYVIDTDPQLKPPTYGL